MISKFSFLVRESFLRVAAIDDVYQKYYSTIPREIFDELVAADPTATLENPHIPLDDPPKPKKIGTYGQWILKMYSEGSLPLEDTEKLYPLLQDMQRLAPILKKEGISFDILKFKTPVELYTFYHEHRKKLPPDPEALDEDAFPDILLEEKYYLDSGEAEKVYEDPDIAIFVPKTLAASKFYGYGSRWCTLYPDNFQKYSSEGTLFIIVFKDKGFKDRWQFHFESDQYMDFRDYDLSDDGQVADFFRKYPGVNHFFKTNIFGDFADKLAPSGQLSAKIRYPESLVEERKGRNAIDIEWLFRAMSGEEEIISYNSGNSIHDIASWNTFSEENTNKIREYLEKNYAEEIEAEGLELSLYSEVFEAVNSFAEDLKDILQEVDIQCTAESIQIRLINNIQDALESHFGGDFSDWYPNDGVVKFDKRIMEENWFAFYKASQTNQIESVSEDISDVLIALSGKVPEIELEDAYRRAEGYGYKTEDFNALLAERLSDLE